MSDVAERADISIGSLYQYFPDRASIIRTLADRYNAAGRACVAGELATVRTEDQLGAALRRVVDGYYAMFLDEPVMRDIWAATQSDKALQELDAADGEAHASMLYDVLVRLRPDRDRTELATVAMVTMQLLATAVRLAISLDRGRGDAVIDVFKRMLPTNLFDELRPPAPPRRKRKTATLS